MTYVPGCQVDVFLSYAHFDEDGDGWVSSLKDRLENKLATYLGSRPVVWLDKRRLRGGDPIQDEIQSKLKHTAVFAAVVSPAYVASEFCMRREFGCFEVLGSDKIVQVLKIPLESGEKGVRPDLKAILFYEERGDDFEEFDRNDSRFARQIEALAKDMRVTLDRMWRERQKVFVSQPATANNGQRLWDYRKQLVGEFEGQSFGVVPRNEILRDARDEFRARRWLEQADISVHLLRRNDPLAQLQWHLAREMGQRTVVAVEQIEDMPTGLLDDELPIVVGRQNWRSEIVDHVRRSLRGTRQNGTAN